MAECEHASWMCACAGRQIVSLLLHDARLLGGRRADLRLSAGVITEIAPTLPFGASEVVDLDGRFVLPGLWDNHVHFTQHALAGQRMDVSAAVSAADVAGMIAAAVGPAAMPGELIVGIGFHDGLWPDAPSREVLDTASGTVPIVVLSADLHSCWLNSAALARFGFPDHPTGLLREDDCFAVTARLQDVPDCSPRPLGDGCRGSGGSTRCGRSRRLRNGAEPRRVAAPVRRRLRHAAGRRRASTRRTSRTPLPTERAPATPSTARPGC